MTIPIEILASPMWIPFGLPLGALLVAGLLIAAGLGVAPRIPDLVAAARAAFRRPRLHEAHSH